MSFVISALFPLGVYQGHNANKHAEDYPSLTRLHAAYTAAAFGTIEYATEDGKECVVDGNTGLPYPYSSAIEWLEGNPPDAIVLPDVIKNETGNTLVFRNKGLISKGKKVKKLPESAVSHAAISGAVLWVWEDAPEEETVEVISDLSTEVPYLGETDSPVWLAAYTSEGIPENAWKRVKGNSIELMNLPTFDVPEKGRAAELQREYLAAYGRIPSVAADKVKTEENEICEEYSKEKIQQVAYQRDDKFSSETKYSPWNQGYLLEVRPKGEAQWPPREDDYLKWAVAVHRALVKKCGNDVPNILAGKSRGRLDTLTKPLANCVAIQIVRRDLSVLSTINFSNDVILVMLPNGASVDEIMLIERAVGSLREVYTKDLGAISIISRSGVDLARFWREPQDGYIRWWQPYPLFIPDSRPPTVKINRGTRWNVDDAIRVALGYVWRDNLNPKQNGDKRLVELSDLVKEQNVTVAGGRMLYPTRISNYVHRTNDDAFLSAATAMINLGNLGSDTAVVAIGQSRHFSGGLLIPIDLPAAIMASGRMNLAEGGNSNG